MADQFVRNNILTLFFAEHETMANTLTWALPCTQMVVKETMRIEPVVSIIRGRFSQILSWAAITWRATV